MQRSQPQKVPVEAGLSADEQRELNALRQRFQDQSRTGPRPRIEDFVSDRHDPFRSALLRQLLQLDVEHRRAEGDTPEPQEYLQRFPNDKASICDFFSAESQSADFAPVAPDTDSWRVAQTLPREDLLASKPLSLGDHPAQIGRYLVERVLGEGGFGRVYLARDPQLNRDVAIKVPKPEHVGGPQEIQAYKSESQAAAKLEHPRIVPVYDFGSTAEHPVFFVSKFVDGQDLGVLLRRRRVSSCEAADLTADVADALQYLHQQGFVHRDIKPANLLIDCHGQVFITDLGLALRDEDRGERLGYLGTPTYMSPEQASGKGDQVDGRSDIFSLGVVLYEMLTHKLPFRGNTTEDTLKQVRLAAPKPPRQINPEIPPELEQICLKALAAEPADRFATAADFAAELRQFVTSAGKGSSKHAVRRTLAVSSIVLLLLSFAIWLIASNQKDLPPLDPELDILVLKDGGTAVKRLGDDRDALPLEVGDRVHVEASLSRPAYLYLIWIDATGEPLPIYPWRNGNWSVRPTEAATSRVSLPTQSGALAGWAVGGQAGMETLVLLARDTPLPPELSLPQLLSGLPETKFHDARSSVWFENGEIVDAGQDRTRSPQFFDVQQLDDPVLQIQWQLRQKLGPYSDAVAACSFANRGEVP